MKFSSVVGYHMNPLTCGVAKFNTELAKRLDVPYVRFDAADVGSFPLYSLKWSEIQSSRFGVQRPYGLFWHDGGDEFYSVNAAVIFYADPSLGPNGLWCPSLITPRKRPVRLFSFGMAHKLQTDKYKRVRELLNAAGYPYHLRVSVGLHEGTSLDGAEKHFDALRDIMGSGHVTILGILSDDAVSDELSSAEYVLAFFENGLRANNTTVHAALEYGRTVVTNWDANTPEDLTLMTADVDVLAAWPHSYHYYNWDNLLREMKGICDNSQSRIA